MSDPDPEAQTTLRSCNVIRLTSKSAVSTNRDLSTVNTDLEVQTTLLVFVQQRLVFDTKMLHHLFVYV